MCWACQEGERERIWALVDIISMGEMPAGHTAEDLRAMGLPQPGELVREEQPDGTILIRQVAPDKAAPGEAAPGEAARGEAARGKVAPREVAPREVAPKNAFVCDSPEQKI